MLPDLIGNRGVEFARSLSHRKFGHLAEILAAAIASVLVYVHRNVSSAKRAQSVEPGFLQPVFFYQEESWSRRDEASGLGLTFVSLEVSAV
jgi:hypothetical protein